MGWYFLALAIALASEMAEYFGVDTSTVCRWENLGIPTRGATGKTLQREWTACLALRERGMTFLGAETTSRRCAIFPLIRLAIAPLSELRGLAVLGGDSASIAVPNGKRRECFPRNHSHNEVL